MEKIAGVPKYGLFSQAKNERRKILKFDKEITEKVKNTVMYLLDSSCVLFILQIQILFVIFTTLDSRYALVPIRYLGRRT